MDWDHLRIVLAIRDGGSLQGAAERLSLDRATVIRRLGALEAGLGARLFDRRSSGCVLTPAGEAIIDSVETISAEVTALSNRVGGDAKRAEGNVTVAMPEFLASALVVPALPRLRESHPDLTLTIITGYAMVNLAQGGADIAIRNQRPDHNTLVARRLIPGGIAFFASRAYLADRGAPGGEGFTGHDVIVPEPAALSLPLFGNAAALASQGRAILRVSESATALAAAKAGLGLALLPCAATLGETELLPVRPGLVARPEGFLVTHRDLRRQGRVRAVADFLGRLIAENAARLSGKDIAERLA
jgi:DNA-binding transcriptional LysR family regulator